MVANINVLSKIYLIMLVFSNIIKVPCLRTKISLALNPVDSTRYVEFSYFLKVVHAYNVRLQKTLDVSSPFVMAYLLSNKGHVTKTDINGEEQRYIKKSNSLEFKREDATRLTFPDNMFDCVYSISVIEHIYENYMNALREMLRVLRPGGHLVLTFPVGRVHKEFWIKENIYSHQHKDNDKVFFEYRFDEDDFNRMLSGLHGFKLIDKSIYWEKTDGQIDRTMARLKKNRSNKIVREFVRPFINLWAGFTLLDGEPGDFSRMRSCGVACVLLQKKYT